MHLLTILGMAALQAASGSWLLLPPDLSPPLRGSMSAAVVEASEDELRQAGLDVVPRDKLEKVLKVLGVSAAQLSADDYYDLCSGLGANGALAVSISQKGELLALEVKAFEAATRRLTPASAEVKRIAILRTLRESIALALRGGLAAPPAAQAAAPPPAAPPSAAAPPPPTAAPAVQAATAPAGMPVSYTGLSGFAPPTAPGLLLFAEGHRLYFGITPGAASEDSGLSSGTTGVSNLGGGKQIGFNGFVGGALVDQQIDQQVTRRLELRGRAALGLFNTKPAGADESATGTDALLSVDSVAGEYLHYLESDGAGLFVGIWGNASGTAYSYSKAAEPDALSTKKLTMPLRVSLGGGFGRVYPIHWRLLLERLEASLRADGAIEADISDDVAAQILATWHHDRDAFTLPADPSSPYGWSYHRQLLVALQILKDANLLVRPVSLISAYRLERLLLDENSIDRWHGMEARAGLRVAKTIDRTWPEDADAVDADTDAAMALELLGRAYYNLSFESDLRIEPAVALSLREEDELTNDLRGARRVSLETAPTDSSSAAFLPTGRVVIDVPVTFRRYVYDVNYNLMGFWNLYAGGSLGYSAEEPALGLGAGVAYTLFTDSRTGYTVGVGGGLGHKNGDLAYNLNFIAVLGLGTGESYYTAPDQVGDSVPFNTDWLPRPVEGGETP